MAATPDWEGNDPGWSYAVQAIRWAAIPVWGARKLRRAKTLPAHGLATLRLLFLNFCVALALIGLVVAILVNAQHFTGSNVNSQVTAIAIAVIGAVSLVTPSVVERPLDCANDHRLAFTYRNRFFTRIAVAETPALSGFAGFILTGRWWIYPLGAAFGAIGFARLAPTAANIEKDQERLDRQGCTRSLIAALARPRPPNTPQVR